MSSAVPRRSPVRRRSAVLAPGRGLPSSLAPPRKAGPFNSPVPLSRPGPQRPLPRPLAAHTAPGPRASPGPEEARGALTTIPPRAPLARPSLLPTLPPRGEGRRRRRSGLRAAPPPPICQALRAHRDRTRSAGGPFRLRPSPSGRPSQRARPSRRAAPHSRRKARRNREAGSIRRRSLAAGTLGAAA